MGKKIDLSSIKKRLDAKSTERTKTSIYVSSEVWEQFRTACGQAYTTSAVLEELMKLYVENQGKKRR